MWHIKRGQGLYCLMSDQLILLPLRAPKSDPSLLSGYTNRIEDFHGSQVLSITFLDWLFNPLDDDVSFPSVSRASRKTFSTKTSIPRGNIFWFLWDYEREEEEWKCPTLLGGNWNSCNLLPISFICTWWVFICLVVWLVISGLKQHVEKGYYLVRKKTDASGLNIYIYIYIAEFMGTDN